MPHLAVTPTPALDFPVLVGLHTLFGMTCRLVEVEPFAMMKRMLASTDLPPGIVATSRQPRPFTTSCGRARMWGNLLASARV